MAEGESLRDQVTAEEWQLARRAISPWLFYRVWTAKEAVLKAEGIGLAGLSHCRVTAIPDGGVMQLAFGRRTWSVVHHDLPAHVVALTQVHSPILWQIDPGWPRHKHWQPSPHEICWLHQK